MPLLWVLGMLAALRLGPRGAGLHRRPQCREHIRARRPVVLSLLPPVRPNARCADRSRFRDAVVPDAGRDPLAGGGCRGRAGDQREYRLQRSRGDEPHRGDAARRARPSLAGNVCQRRCAQDEDGRVPGVVRRSRASTAARSPRFRLAPHGDPRRVRAGALLPSRPRARRGGVGKEARRLLRESCLVRSSNKPCLSPARGARARRDGARSSRGRARKGPGWAGARCSSGPADGYTGGSLDRTRSYRGGGGHPRLAR